jgi:acyl-CoA thioesterase-1
MRTPGTWLLLGLLALGACTDGSESPARPEPGAAAGTPADADVPAGAPLVIFLGDSISAGLHVDPRDAYPAVVQRQLAAEGPPFRLVNAGVSGDTSAGGLRRLDWLLGEAPGRARARLGGNDGPRGQPVKEIEARLHEIVERARAKDVRVLILGVRLRLLGGTTCATSRRLRAPLRGLHRLRIRAVFGEAAAGRA